MGLSVIGAGFGRTGTLSLKGALEKLGFGACYHMMEILANPSFAAYWVHAADGKPVDWDQIFAGYGATVDWPSTAFYKELADHYPDAKIILTVRDPDKWFESTQNTIFSPMVHEAIPDEAGKDRGRMAEKVIIQGVFDGRQNDRDHAISVYTAHNKAVQQTIPPERLLVYELSQGWEPLCAFLDRPVPDAPFPSVNSTDEFKQMIAAGGPG